MHIVCTDLEGVFVPEIWINVAEKTGVDALRRTTRDEPDYDVLMRYRLDILHNEGITIDDITEVIDSLEPLPGARNFLDWLRARTQVIVLSDTFEQFAGPLMEKLGWPTLFCNSLSVDADRFISDYHLRQPDGKRQCVLALKGLYYQVAAMGDSYNDISMLLEADHGVLYCPPKSVRKAYPQLPVAKDYAAVGQILEPILAND